MHYLYTYPNLASPMPARLISDLKKRLNKKLPGMPSQLIMAPASSRITKGAGDTIEAGVLILLFPDNGELSTLFIKRTEYPGPHSGQISFPGGKSEINDSSPIDTALRETSEETGIDINRVSVLGTLTRLYIPVSNIEVTPVVGYSEFQPLFNINRNEVEYLIIVPLKELSEKNRRTRKTLSINGFTIDAPGYKIKNEFIWGATAMILSEFTEILSEPGTTIQ
jgi:8-oxo-dGTP pyrophosphatase MutT (NUDIX family)